MSQSQSTIDLSHNELPQPNRRFRQKNIRVGVVCVHSLGHVHVTHYTLCSLHSGIFPYALDFVPISLCFDSHCRSKKVGEGVKEKSNFSRMNCI